MTLIPMHTTMQLQCLAHLVNHQAQAATQQVSATAQHTPCDCSHPTLRSQHNDTLPAHHSKHLPLHCTTQINNDLLAMANPSHFTKRTQVTSKNIWHLPQRKTCPLRSTLLQPYTAQQVDSIVIHAITSTHEHHTIADVHDTQHLPLNHSLPPSPSLSLSLPALFPALSRALSL